MGGDMTASFSRHWCVLCLCLLTIVIQCQIASASIKDTVHPPGRFKRGSVVDPIVGFLKAVKSHPMDLIILIERSRSVGRWLFYRRARKLVSYVMRYYIKMGPSNVRLEVASFASDFTDHIRGMSGNIMKCQIWDKYWDDVVLDDTPSVYDTAFVKFAYEKAKILFDNYSSLHREKYIWLLTSGNYRMDTYDPRPIASDLIRMGVQIVATNVGGSEGNKRNIEQVVNSKAHHGGDVLDWITTLKNVTEIIDETNLVRSSLASTLCYCEQSFGFTICGSCINEPCTTGNTCSNDCVCPAISTIPHLLCPKHNTRKVCPALGGMTGRYCQIKVRECLRGTCANNGTCHEAQGSYTCNCPAPYSNESLCEYVDGRNPYTTTTVVIDVNATSSMGAAVGGAGGGLSLIIILVVGICCWRKKKKTDTRDASTNTYQARPNASSTTSSLNPLSLFRRKGGSTQSEASSGYSLDIFELFRRKKGVQTPSGGTGSYLEIESVPPAVPRSIPPPTVRPSNSKPRKSLRGLLQYIPPHLHPSTTQWEVEKAVSVINVDNQRARGGEDDDDDATDYENVGSKNMPGWENYAIRLATEGGLRNFAIVRHDREAYVTTCEIWLLPTKDELEDIYNVMLSRRTGGYVKIKSARYKVTKNNGKMMESWLEGRTPDVLCVGRSKQYLTLGVETDRANTGNCYQEVKWVRDDLSDQGK